MDFGDILDDWERRSAKPGGLDQARDAESRLKAEEEARRKADEAERRLKRTAARKSLTAWLDEYGVEDKDSGREQGDGDGEKGERALRDAEARRLKAKKADDRIDLHGMTQAQAEAALEAFLEASARRGLEKVLVITGKGIHSQGEPILGRAARRVIEASRYAGRFGTAEAQEGGTGALFVLIRRPKP